MKSILVMATFMFVTITNVSAQIKNSKTDSIKVYGNCGMCKAKIEKAGTQKNVSKVTWSEETAMATITYDTKKTTTDVILKKIAFVGYDSEKFRAPNTVYKKLHGCCKYERPLKLKK
jgi:copper chaperone CopZ